jgi:3-dehydroquinate dehydratase/shikimate dehydrogenase
VVEARGDSAVWISVARFPPPVFDGIKARHCVEFLFSVWCSMMFKSKICLCLTGRTLQENLNCLDKYRKYVDIAELRADFLDKDECLQIRRFPPMAGVPCILTIRRKADGGNFTEGEAARAMLFARGLAFAESDAAKNFAYVDFEEDFYVPSLQEATLVFGTRIIRSRHNVREYIPNIASKIATMRVTGYEIAKISCCANSIADITDMFREAQKLKDSEHILCAMGPYGLPTRILSSLLGSYLTYTSPEEMLSNVKNIGHIDPQTLEQVFRFRNIGSATKIFGIMGFPMEKTLSPQIHNKGFHRHGMNAVYIPVRAQRLQAALEFADMLGMRGLSVTIPHKEKMLKYLCEKSDVVQKIGACNTIVRAGNGWKGYNTDVYGIKCALKEFLGVKNLFGIKTAIIGAGGAAKAVAFAVNELKGDACVFNRTVLKAKKIAELYGFKWAVLNSESFSLLEKYSDLIIQTTSVGMGAYNASGHENDPLVFYDFSGKEALYDIIYTPEITPVMARASAAGCKTANGLSMLAYQAHEQFRLFTGEEYEPSGTK